MLKNFSNECIKIFNINFVSCTCRGPKQRRRVTRRLGGSEEEEREGVRRGRKGGVEGVELGGVACTRVE